MRYGRLGDLDFDGRSPDRQYHGSQIFKFAIMLSRLIRRFFPKLSPPPRRQPRLSRIATRRNNPFSPKHVHVYRSTLPAPASLHWVVPKADYEATLLSIQSRLDRELESPTSLIWANVEAVEESAYPETFKCRGGLEIACPEETKRVANWVKRELMIKGYKGIKVEVSGTERYGSFTVSAEKPPMSMSK
jgi:hypothetical protein